METIGEKKINNDILWLRIALILLSLAIGICFTSVYRLKGRVEMLETPVVNPYKTQVLFKI